MTLFYLIRKIIVSQNLLDTKKNISRLSNIRLKLRESFSLVTEHVQIVNLLLRVFVQQQNVHTL